jgi:CTP synthase (UTP-ammonia lyase)
MRPLTIAVLMDLPPQHAYHRATIAALAHAAAAVSDVRAVVVPTDAIRGRSANELGDGIVVGPGSPYRNRDAALDVIRSAREGGVALVGT